MFGYGGWMPVCTVCSRTGDHTDGKGTYFCKTHYQMRVLGWDECVGCLGTGNPHSNGKPVPNASLQKCNLCKGEGVLAP